MANPKRIIPSLLFILTLSSAPLAFTWAEYEGTTQWKVKVTDDETGCGGGLKANEYVATIQHKLSIADLSNIGHGASRGTFEGDTLVIPARAIPDGQGTSKLSETRIAFTPDCASFTSVYSWNYQDSYSQCSGTTTLRGTRVGATSCPEAFSPRTQIVAARADPDAASKERRYQEILQKDPANFWANWDMAELKMKQGRYDDYFKYFENAANNEKVFQKTRERLKEEVLKKLRVTSFPTTKTSPLLRIEKGELDNWQASFTYNEAVLKRPANNQAWYVTLWRMYGPDPSDLPERIAGLPE